MKLVLHILEKDLRRLKTPLLAWGFLVLLPVLTGLLGHGISPKDTVFHMAMLQGCFYDSWLQQFLTIVLVGLVIQEEALVGSQVFWVTRPISPWMLVQEKFFFIGSLLVAFPLAAGMVSLALEGMTMGDIQLALPEMLLQQLGTVFVAALAAVLTPNFGRFLPVALFMCFLQWLTSYLPVIGDLLNRDSDRIAGELDMLDCRWVVTTLLTVFLGFLLIVHQYKTRRVRRTALLALACLGLIFGVGGFWKWNFLKPFKTPADLNRFNDWESPNNHRFSVGMYEALPFLETRQGKAPRIIILGELKTNGVSPKYEYRYCGTQINYPDNDLITKDDWLVNVQGFELDTRFRWRDNPLPSAVESALGGPLVMNPQRGKTDVEPLLVLDPGVYRKYLDQVDALRISPCFDIVGYRKDAELPLAEGSGFREGSRSVTILEVSPQINGVNVKLQDQAPYLLLKNDPKIAPSVLDLDDFVYVLVNPKKMQVFLSEPRSRQWEGDLLQAKQPLRVDRQVLKFVGNGGSTGPLLDEAWLRDAELVRLKVETIDNWNTQIIVDPFSLKGNGGQFQVPSAGSLTYDFGIPLREQ